MIKNLKIKNFKDINDVKLEGLSKVTVISGMNNIGKTSILEAILLLYNYSISSILAPSLSNRSNAAIVNAGFEQAISALFHNFNILNNIEIETQLYKLKTKFSSNLKLTIQQGQDITTSTTVDVLGIEFNYEKSGKVFASSKAIKNTLAGGAYLAQPTKVIHQTQMENLCLIDEHGEIKSGADVATITEKNLGMQQEVTFNPFNFESPLVREFGKIRSAADANEKRTDLIDALKIIDPMISNIELGLDPVSRAPRLELIKNGVPISINSFGSGTKRFLNIILGVIAAKDGVLLIDEIENGLHYSVMAKMWELIFNLSEKYNCQIIAISHSWEMPGYIVGLDINKKNMSYINLTKKDGRISSGTYNYDDFEYSIKNNTELR